MEVYLVRHGETSWNREGRYYGDTDISLSERGLLQAENLGRYFRKIEFDKVIASPLKRAVDTAKKLTEKEVRIDERLREQSFGLFEGKTYQELTQEYPAELAAWNQEFQEYCIPGGESFHMVRNRVESFAKELWKEQGKMLIVAHKGTFGHLLAVFLGLPLEGYWNFVFEQGTYSRIDLEDGFAIFRCLNAEPNIQE